jgi:hypothetical protein
LVAPEEDAGLVDLVRVDLEDEGRAVAEQVAVADVVAIQHRRMRHLRVN